MASNSFGRIFRITTFGESHGKAMGVVIDGCPAGLDITHDEIQKELNRRRPGFSRYTSPRREEDQVEILSGVFEGKTTGAPITLLIANRDVDSSKYEPIKSIYRPGHANYTYLAKYGIFDYRGGGRASARETVARVAAGALAKKIIQPMEVRAWVDEVGGERGEEAMVRVLEAVMREGDSVGAVIAAEITSVPVGLGDPVYEKLEANLASAMLSIPATKGIEFGKGFHAAKMRGSEHNDGWRDPAVHVVHEDCWAAVRELGWEHAPRRGRGAGFLSNAHGGILGGISSGETIVFRVAFKPTSSIKKPQRSVNFETGEEETFTLPEGSRQDPCVALRAPPIVESMAAIVLADARLSNRCSKIS